MDSIQAAVTSSVEGQAQEIKLLAAKHDGEIAQRLRAVEQREQELRQQEVRARVMRDGCCLRSQ